MTDGSWPIQLRGDVVEVVGTVGDALEHNLLRLEACGDPVSVPKDRKSVV